MKDEKITILLELSADDIRLIADESEHADNPEFSDFLGRILRETDEAARKTSDVIRKIIDANPYSRQRRETDR